MYLPYTQSPDKQRVFHFVRFTTPATLLDYGSTVTHVTGPILSCYAGWFSTVAPSCWTEFSVRGANVLYGHKLQDP